MNNANVLDYKNIAARIRKKILKMHTNAGTSHIGSALSCVDILTVLYFGVLKIDSNNSLDPNRDRFILSKGHAVSALYAILAERGFFSEKLLGQYCVDGGKLPGHASLGVVPGIEASSGSLGHGLPMGIGMVLSAKYEKSKYKTFVLLSDGECDEGSVWEATLFAAHHKLDNLIVIVDYNKIQALGKTNDIINLEPFARKWTDFGWSAKEINGHNFSEITSAFENIPFKKNKPSIIVAHTVKGKGISFMENKLLWHYKSPNEKQLQAGMEELSKI